MEKKGIWTSRMICVTCTPFPGYVPAVSEKMSGGKTVAVVVVLVEWICLKNCKKAADKRLGEKKSCKNVSNFLDSYSNINQITTWIIPLAVRIFIYFHVKLLHLQNTLIYATMVSWL